MNALLIIAIGGMLVVIGIIVTIAVISAWAANRREKSTDR